jgi:hypothetical protein
LLLAVQSALPRQAVRPRWQVPPQSFTVAQVRPGSSEQILLRGGQSAVLAQPAGGVAPKAQVPPEVAYGHSSLVAQLPIEPAHTPGRQSALVEQAASPYLQRSETVHLWPGLQARPLLWHTPVGRPGQSPSTKQASPVLHLPAIGWQSPSMVHSAKPFWQLGARQCASRVQPLPLAAQRPCDTPPRQLTPSSQSTPTSSL